MNEDENEVLTENVEQVEVLVIEGDEQVDLPIVDDDGEAEPLVEEKPAPAPQQNALTQDMLDMLAKRGLTIAPIQPQAVPEKHVDTDPVKELDDHYEKIVMDANENMDSEKAAKATREWMVKRTELANRSIQSRLDAVEMASQIPVFRKQYKDLGYPEEAGDEFVELQKQVPPELRSNEFVKSLMAKAAIANAQDKVSKHGNVQSTNPSATLPTVQRSGAPVVKSSLRDKIDPVILKSLDANNGGRISDADLKKVYDRGGFEL